MRVANKYKKVQILVKKLQIKIKVAKMDFFPANKPFKCSKIR